MSDQSKKPLVIIISCTGILFGILSGANHFYFKENCVEKIKSVEEFQECIKKSRKKIPFIKNVGLKSFNEHILLNTFNSMDMILPENGSIGIKRKFTDPTFVLDPGYSFVLALFDKDFFIYVSNPLIVQRSVLNVRSNSSWLTVGIKVSIYCLLHYGCINSLKV